MTLTTDTLSPPDDDLSTQTTVQYHYDVRLEIGEQKGGGAVPVVAIFHDLIKNMKNAADPDTPFIVLTTNDNIFYDQKEMTSAEFKREFHVDQSEHRRPGKMAFFGSGYIHMKN